MSCIFFFNSIMLGFGLAADAFTVSLANGLCEPEMKAGKMCTVAGVFAGFQTLMPLFGWVCVSTLVRFFQSLEKFIPWIALVLLTGIGCKMIAAGLKPKEETTDMKTGWKTLFIQGVATSIDALSVGFTIAEYSFISVFVCCLIIGSVTFAMCMGGLIIGRKFGVLFAGKASVTGGVILIIVGLEIFLNGMT